MPLEDVDALLDEPVLVDELPDAALLDDESDFGLAEA